MVNLFEFSEYEMLAFFLTLVRISAFVVAWPVFDVPLVPMPVKILFSLVFAVMLFPTIDQSHLSVDLLDNQMILMTIREAFIGLVFGFLAKMFFFAIRIAGEIISVSIGLSSSQLFNPALGGQTATIEQFKVIVASLFFLSINGHHLFIAGMVDTFRLIPLSDQMLNLDKLNTFVGFVSDIMVVGIKISAPVLISIFFTNMTMAIIGRTVPQINVLITSLPVNILVGLIIMFISVPLLVWQMHSLLDLTTDHLFTLVRTF